MSNLIELYEELTPFPCTACGKCCRNIHLNDTLSYLDKGNGVCKHLIESSNLCANYDGRPLVCRIEDYYKNNLTGLFTWNEYVNMNLEVCKKL